MSRPGYIWWTYVQGMIRKYPERAAALGDLRAVGMTAKYSAEPSGGGAERTTEAVALRELPAVEQREYDAVRAALEHLVTMPDGNARLRLVQMVYWERTAKLFKAARAIGISERTAQRWNASLVYSVAKKYGFFDKLA